MTKTGFNWILHAITTMKVEMPKEPLIAIEAKAWMDGYLKAQSDILTLLEKMGEEQKE